MGYLPAFVKDILARLRRFEECANDFESVDIGSFWIETLTGLNLLTRTQRSPERWEITPMGEDFLSEFAEDASRLNEEKVYGPYLVKWIGPGVWAGIPDELPAELEGSEVFLHRASRVIKGERG
jgi:hypothetical protein